MPTLKIVVDLEGDQFIIPTSKVIVSVDDNPVGMIQHLKLEADANSVVTDVEITLPDLSRFETYPNLKEKIEENIKILKRIPAITIKLKDIMT